MCCVELCGVFASVYHMFISIKTSLSGLPISVDLSVGVSNKTEWYIFYSRKQQLFEEIRRKIDVIRVGANDI